MLSKFRRLTVCELDARELPATFTIANGDVAGLIAAIKTANSNNQADTIQLASSGTYVLNTVLNGENGLPVITADGGHTLTVNGRGATITRGSQAAPLRFFQVNGGHLLINQITLTGGQTAGPGAALCVLDGNLTVRTSTLNANTSTDCEGGAIYAGPNADKVVVQNTTIANNVAAQFGGGVAIYGGSATLTNVTLASNRVVGLGAGGLHVYGGTVVVQNSILGNNYAPGTSDDLGRSSGVLTSRYSLIENMATGVINGTATANILNVDPQLGALANNGGLTKTLLPLAGSRVINAGSNSYSPGSTDQRGQARIAGTAIDLGAVEVPAVSAPKPPATPVKPPVVTPTNLGTLTTIVGPSASTIYGEKASFTATVKPQTGTSTPTGKISFYIAGKLVSTVNLSQGKATYATTTLAIGTHQVMAKFIPTGTFLASHSPTIKHTVLDKLDNRHWKR